jgi:NAD(P)-dependent dehydrogenase (short-subunit alcohol dehydrogenase family)
MHELIRQAFDLTGRVAIVTGGTRGLGNAAAEWLSAAGAIVAVAGRSRAVATEAARALPNPAVGFECDVAEEWAVSALVDSVLDEFDRIDILVNSAGVNLRGSATTMPLAEFEEVQRVNTAGTWLMCREVAGHMIDEGRGGRIINFASMLSEVGMAGRSSYSASKGAVMGMTRSLALEWAPHRITVNAVIPGPFATDMNAAVIENRAVHDEFVATIPLGRFGDPAELGPVVLFLASDASSFVTGTGFAVDGGWTAQ